MKFQVQMKDPDTLHDSIRDAVDAELGHSDLPADEQELVVDARVEKLSKACSKWFRYGEYLTVEIDTDAGTCVVVPCS